MSEPPARSFIAGTGESVLAWNLSEDMYSVQSTVNRPDAPYAIFDFDSTLVVCKGRGPEPELSVQLVARMHRAGYNIAILSNRSSGKFTGAALEPFDKYLLLLSATLNYPAECIVATVCALFSAKARKPQTLSWKFLKVSEDGKKRSFYCGDAAGRAKYVSVNGCAQSADHSSADIDFAHNCGIPFVTPEALLGYYNCGREPMLNSMAEPILPWPTVRAGAPAANNGEAVAVKWGVRCGADYDENTRKLLTAKAKPLPQLSGTVDIVDNIFAKAKGSPVAIIMMGSPGSGKSTWVKRNCGAGFVVLSRDTGGAHWERKAAEALKLQNAHIVIDNTHPTSASRDESIVIAMRGGVKAENIHIVHITTPVHVCIHLNEARRATGAASVPTIAIHVYWKKMDKLAAAGIGGMVEVPFAMEANAPAEIARHVYRLKGR